MYIIQYQNIFIGFILNISIKKMYMGCNYSIDDLKNCMINNWGIYELRQDGFMNRNMKQFINFTITPRTYKPNQFDIEKKNRLHTGLAENASKIRIEQIKSSRNST